MLKNKGERKILKRTFSVLMLTLLLTSMLSLVFDIQPSKAGNFTSANGVTGTTYVEGNITVDTTWTAAGSPYIVTGNILVENGAILTIEPGVIVKFNSAKAIQVDGQLVARGTETDPILFTSNHPSPTAGDWAGIWFTDSSIDASYDEAGNYLSGTVMQYCTIKYGGGSSPALKIESASPFIDNCVIKNNNSPAIYISQGSPKINNSTITNNSISISSNAYGSGIYASGDGTIISGNILTNNSISAVSTWSYHYNAYGGGIYASGRITIDDNIITNNSALGIGNPFYGADAYGGGIYASGLVTISNNIVTDNLAFGSYADVHGGGIYASGAVTISNNIVANNSASGSDRYGGGIYVSGEGPVISGNIIINNSVSGGTVTGWTYAYGGGIYASGDRIVVSDNSISYNSALNSYGYGCGGGIYVTGNGVNINGNSITDNTVSGRDAYSGRRFAARGGGIYVSGAATINGNIIAYNSAYSRSDGGYTVDAFGGGVYGSGSVAISNNKIANNSALDRGGGIYGGNSVTNNSVINNLASEGGGVYGSAAISGNTIVGNRISRGDGKGGGIYISGQPSINYNNIYGSTPYDVYNSNPQGSPDVDATNNWWGTIIDAQIQENIYDWFDDASLGIVDYIPYLSTHEITAPISPPTGLNATAEDSVVKLSWSANPETDLAGYRVYYDIDSGYPYVGTGANEGSSGIDVGNVINYPLSGLRNGITYYIAVTAYDSSGDESWYSNEAILTIAVPDFSITASPTFLTIQQGNSGTLTITVISINGFDQPVQLTVSGTPLGVTATLNPQQVTPPADGSITSTLTVTVGTTATLGSYTLTVTGTSGPLTHSADISLEITGAPPPPNQPPSNPTGVSQYRSDGVTVIPEGGTTPESTVVFKATVSDSDGDSVRLEIELRQIGEAFTGEPTLETISDFVPSGTQVTITRYGLVNADYKWQYRAKDINGATSDWTEFGNVGNIDFGVGLVFRSPYAVGDKYADKSAYGPWTRTYCYSSVNKITGVGAIVAAATVVSFSGVACSEASITFIDTWRSTFSGECRIVGTFSISGDIGVWILYADAMSSIALDASLTVYDSTEGRDVLTATKPISELILYSMDNIHKSFPGSTFFLEGLLDLIEGHSYSWIFEIRLKATVATVSLVASGNAWGGIREAKLIQVCLQPPEPWSSPPEGPVYTIENALWVAVGSPVEVLVVDPDGRRVGFDFISKQEVNEIPDACYSGPNVELQFIYIPRPLIGHYKISLAGTDRGTYALIATSIEPGEATSFRTIEIPVATNEIHQYTVDWAALSLGEEDITVQVDSDGDGVFERTFASDSELSQDEFVLAARKFYAVWEDVGYPVFISSNSTVSHFTFNQPQKQISFNLTELSGTKGYCNITIPKDLLKGPWTYTMDGETPSFIDFSEDEDATHSFIYITYIHASTFRITIQGTWVIPEFPSTIILPLFILVTLIATIIWKKKRKAKPQLP